MSNLLVRLNNMAEGAEIEIVPKLEGRIRWLAVKDCLTSARFLRPSGGKDSAGRRLSGEEYWLQTWLPAASRDSVQIWLRAVSNRFFSL